jgi:high-affinity nickel permease
MKMFLNKHYSMGILRSVMSLLFCVQVGLAFSVAGQENTCDANGSVYYVGEWHFLDSDHCSSVNAPQRGLLVQGQNASLCTPLASMSATIPLIAAQDVRR